MRIGSRIFFFESIDAMIDYVYASVLNKFQILSKILCIYIRETQINSWRFAIK